MLTHIAVMRAWCPQHVQKTSPVDKDDRGDRLIGETDDECVERKKSENRNPFRCFGPPRVNSR